MRMNDNDRKQITAQLEFLMPIPAGGAATINPSTGSVVLRVDGTEHPCAWVEVNPQATGDGDTFQRFIGTVRTVGFIAGPNVPTGQLNGASVLSMGSHDAEVVATIGGTILACRTVPIRVTQ